MSDELPAASSPDAPPPPDVRNATPRELTRVYESGEVRVRWYAGRCIHTGECIRAAPGAFDARRRPWIDLAAAPTAAIVAAVERCPTGALEYERMDATAGERPLEPAHIRAVRNGPLYVRGDLVISDEQGREIRRCTRAALCRCGASGNKPFCDNAHRAAGFRTD